MNLGRATHLQRPKCIHLNTMTRDPIEEVDARRRLRCSLQSCGGYWNRTGWRAVVEFVPSALAGVTDGGALQESET